MKFAGSSVGDLTIRDLGVRHTEACLSNLKQKGIPNIEGGTKLGTVFWGAPL